MNSLKKQLKSLENNLPIEDENLLNHTSVKEEMQRQWDTEPQVTVDLLEEREYIWQSLSERVFPKINLKRYRLYKITAIAATILLCIVTGGFLLERKFNTESPMYVISTGKQDKNTIILADGTSVKLGAGSKLTYPQQFTSGKRVVKLEGQAFFDIAQNRKKPFSVEVGNVTVTALGTSFEVFCNNRNNTIETILLTGRVRVDYVNESSGESGNCLVYPNQKLTVYVDTGDMNVESRNSDEYSAWRNYDGLNFINERMSVIIPRLEYWYGSKIICDSEAVLNERFTFKIQNESLDRILDHMSKVSIVRYSKDDNAVYTLFE